MTVAWVLGGSGLLGSALCRSLRHEGAELFSPDERFRWGAQQAVAQQLTDAVRAFAARAGGAARWEIYWAAGVGTMGSVASELVAETAALSLLFDLIASEPRLRSLPGAIAFASSAGAIYAGSSDGIISESTPPAPTTDYARAKLEQEGLVRSFVSVHNGMAALVARLSTLYGPGQSFGKKQGLLAHIARCMLRNEPIQIYVPFDTIRDYIVADDAAAALIFALRAAATKQIVLTKIIASEQPTTIAEIISIFKRIARRAPRIVTSASSLTSIYSRRVQFRSVVAPECAPAPRTSLLIGISQVMAAERVAYMQGRQAHV